MPFPEVSRIIFGKNPLRQVICQLRFPTILRIDAEIPVAFQDRLHTDFPSLTEKFEWRMELTAPTGEQLVPPEVLSQALKSSGNKNYEFTSDDSQWKVNLTRSFVALSTNEYSRWEKFREKLLVSVSSLVDIYAPAYFSRIGLRYIDVIKRSELGLNGIAWNELLQPYILGVLGSADVADCVTSLENHCEIRMPDSESQIRMVTRLVADPDGEVCFMMDSDVSVTVQATMSEAFERLDYFNKRSSRLIQWCITQRVGGRVKWVRSA
jgi:uncharacterized protein (TIGR04255 family)